MKTLYAATIIQGTMAALFGAVSVFELVRGNEGWGIYWAALGGFNYTYCVEGVRMIKALNNARRILDEIGSNREGD